MATLVPTHEEKTMPASSNTITEAAAATGNRIENGVTCISTDIPVNFCYTCDSHVQSNNVFDHLFFGTLDCKLCSFKIFNCQRFQSVFKANLLPCMDSKTGEHDYMWSSGIPDYLSYFKLKELSINRFCSNETEPPSSSEVLHDVGQYLMSLSTLENYHPWKLGFESCKRYPKLALMLSEYEKSSLAKVNEKQTKLQLGTDSKSLSSDKVCENSINSEPCNVNPVKKTNDTKCTPEKHHGIEVSESAIEKLNQNEQNNKDEKISNITTTFSLPKSAELELNKKSSETLNSINNSNALPLRTELTDSSKDSTKPMVNDCPLIIPEQNLIDDDSDDVLLQNCSLENLDQTVEYVTIEDATENDSRVIEEWESLSHAVNGEDAKEADTLTGKRKASDRTVDGFEDELKLQKFCKSYHKSNNADFDVPDKIAGDNYLVIHYPSQGCPEECPNCYCEFCPSMLTVNCSTHVSTIICADCNLTLYVLPD